MFCLNKSQQSKTFNINKFKSPRRSFCRSFHAFHCREFRKGRKRSRLLRSLHVLCLFCCWLFALFFLIILWRQIIQIFIGKEVCGDGNFDLWDDEEMQRTILHSHLRFLLPRGSWLYKHDPTETGPYAHYELPPPLRAQRFRIHYHQEHQHHRRRAQGCRRTALYQTTIGIPFQRSSSWSVRFLVSLSLARTIKMVVSESYLFLQFSVFLPLGEGLRSDRSQTSRRQLGSLLMIADCPRTYQQFNIFKLQEILIHSSLLLLQKSFGLSLRLGFVDVTLRKSVTILAATKWAQRGALHTHCR